MREQVFSKRITGGHGRGASVDLSGCNTRFLKVCAFMWTRVLMKSGRNLSSVRRGYATQFFADPLGCVEMLLDFPILNISSQYLS